MTSDLTPEEREAIEWGIRLLAELRELSALPREDDLTRMVESWSQSLDHRLGISLQIQENDERLLLSRPRSGNLCSSCKQQIIDKQATPDNSSSPAPQTHE